jgi:hypothetical protein
MGKAKGIIGIISLIAAIWDINHIFYLISNRNSLVSSQAMTEARYYEDVSNSFLYLVIIIFVGVFITKSNHD